MKKTLIAALAGLLAVVSFGAPRNNLVPAMFGATASTKVGSFLYESQIFLTGYSNRTTSLANFPVAVVLSNNVNNSGFQYSTMLTTNGYDLRFRDAFDSTNLNYEITTWNTGGVSICYVQVPTLKNDGSTVILMKWGDSNNLSQMPCTTNGATWDSSFQTVYHLNSTNQNVYDSTYRHLQAVQSTGGSAPILTNGVLGYASYFTNQDNNTKGGWFNAKNSWLPANGQSTISMWTWRPTISGVGMGSGYIMDTPTGSRLVLNDGANSTANTLTYYDGAWHSTGAGNMTPYVWQHRAYSFNHTGNSGIGYVNGLSVGSSTYAYSGNVTNLLFFNYETAASGSTYDTAVGAYQEIRISTNSRSADWVWAEALNGLSNSWFNPVQAAQQIMAVAPVISVNPSSQTVYAPTPATFSVLANGATPMTYAWTTNGVAVLGNNQNSLTFNPTTTAMSGTVVQVTVQNSYGSAVSGSAILGVWPTNQPPLMVSPAYALNVNRGYYVNLSAFAVHPVGYTSVTYTWGTTGAPPSTPTFGAWTPEVPNVSGPNFNAAINGTPTATNLVAIVTAPGQYYFQCLASDALGLTTTNIVPVLVQRPCVVCPAGDSITAGKNGSTNNVYGYPVSPYCFSYWGPAWVELTQLGFNLQYVGIGGQPWNIFGNAWATDGPDLRLVGESNNEGYSSAPSTSMNMHQVAVVNNPDIVSMWVGINDFNLYTSNALWGSSVPTNSAGYTNYAAFNGELTTQMMFEAAYVITNRPTIPFMVCTITDNASIVGGIPMHNYVVGYNGWLQNYFVPYWKAQGLKIALVDTAQIGTNMSGVLVSGWTGDGVHPSDIGYTNASAIYGGGLNSLLYSASPQIAISPVSINDYTNFAIGSTVYPMSAVQGGTPPYTINYYVNGSQLGSTATNGVYPWTVYSCATSNNSYTTAIPVVYSTTSLATGSISTNTIYATVTDSVGSNSTSAVIHYTVH